jgi:hypothetical protein
MSIHPVAPNSVNPTFFKDEGFFFFLGKMENILRNIFVYIIEYWISITHPQPQNLHNHSFHRNPRPDTPVRFSSPLQETSHTLNKKKAGIIESNTPKELLGECIQSFEKLPLDSSKKHIKAFYFHTQQKTYNVYKEFFDDQTDCIERLVLNEKNQLIQYESQDNPTHPVNFQYDPQTQIISIKDKENPQEYQLKRPWVQEFAFALKFFLLSQDEKIIIETIQPNKDYTVRELEISKIGKETISLTGQKIETLKVEAVPNVWGGSLGWKATLWYDLQDHRLLRQITDACILARSFELYSQIDSAN